MLNRFRGFLNHPGLMVFKWRVMFRSIIVKGRWISCHGKCPRRMFNMISLISVLKFARVHVHIIPMKKNNNPGMVSSFSRFAGLLFTLISSNLWTICLYFFDHDPWSVNCIDYIQLYIKNLVKFLPFAYVVLSLSFDLSFSAKTKIFYN